MLRLSLSYDNGPKISGTVMQCVNFQGHSLFVRKYSKLIFFNHRYCLYRASHFCVNITKIDVNILVFWTYFQASNHQGSICGRFDFITLTF